MKLISLFFMLLVTSTLSFAAQSRGDDNDERRGPPRQPPQEAIDACVDKSENEAVSFAGRNGDDVAATCIYIEDQLVAVPDNHKRK
ncbi:hypothetical protein J3L16_02450 [Alteromonas sp. 5E99-2]|uniref:hypothetical protein n=1 Tax=Alteromonas sp. 5E99-2 TaxID=2817683 RepID=UPI001A98FFF2|nr:hypothetical protein [Alteromonas sp. 5E99-2]MBO1254544.1 hypothetical protein [Alteromonas sp. 5E99-2]